MQRRVELLIVAFLLFLGAACCQDTEKANAIYGSQCEHTSCSFDQVTCYRYESGPTAPSLEINYRSDDGSYAAILVLDIDGIAARVADHEFVGDELQNRVTLYSAREGSTWPDFDGHQCVIEAGGDEIGTSFKGHCGFEFPETGGMLATLKWSCTLAAPE